MATVQSKTSAKVDDLLDDTLATARIENDSLYVTSKGGVDTLVGSIIDNKKVNASGDTTGATDTAALQAALASLSYMSGTTRPTTSALTIELGPGPYYINPNVLVLRPAQRFIGRSPVSTFIYCVGGTSGQVFIDRKDPSFSLSGVDPTSQGGELANITLDGSKAGTGTIGIKCGDSLSSRMDVVVQKFGGNAIATATTSVTATVGGVAHASTGLTQNSHIVTDTAIALTDLGATVTGTSIPAGSYVGGVVAGVSYTLTYASGPAPLNATATGTITAQIGFVRSDANVGTTSGSNAISDTAAIANDLGSYIYGTGIPSGAVIIGVTPGVGYRIGVASKGVLYKNTNGWYERNIDRVMCFDNAESIVFDQASPSAFNSNSYCDFWFDIRSKHGQRGVSFRGNTVLYGAKVRLTGGVSAVASPVNHGIFLHMHGNGGGASVAALDIQVESGGGSNSYTGAVPIHSADGSSTLYGHGNVSFYCSAGNAPWQAAKRVTGTLSAASTSINVSGFIAGLGNASANVFSYGSPSFRTMGLASPMGGSLSISGSTITLYHGTGNFFKAGNSMASGTAYTFQFDTTPSVGTSGILEYTVVLQQPGSGTPASIASWPANITFAGTASTTTPVALDQAFGSRTVIQMLSTDGGSTWTVWRENETHPTIFNVKEFGAVGDGVANDVAVIHAARDAAGAGRTVYFPAGTYAVSSGLNASLANQTWELAPGASLVGNGSNHVVNVTASGFTIRGGKIDIGSGSIYSGVMVNNNLSDVTVEKVEIYNGTYAVRCKGGTGPVTTRLHVRQCHIHNTSSHGVFFNYETTDSDVVDCDIHDTTGNGVWLGNGSTGCRVEGNTINDCGRIGIEIYSQSHAAQVRGNNLLRINTIGVSLDTSNHCRVESNDIDTVTVSYGLELAASNHCICIGNTITRPNTIGISISAPSGSCDDNLVMGNTIDRPGGGGIIGGGSANGAKRLRAIGNEIIEVGNGAGAQSAISGVSNIGCDGWMIMDNIIRWTTTPASSSGINCAIPNSIISDNHIICDAGIATAGGTAITLGALALNCMVMGNIIEGNAKLNKAITFNAAITGLLCLGNKIYGVQQNAIDGSGLTSTTNTIDGNVAQINAGAGIDLGSALGSNRLTSQAYWTHTGPHRFDGNLGFYGTSPTAKLTVTGSKGSNAALTSLLSQLATLGLITDSTT